LLVGPVFYRELATVPRRPRIYIFRAVYAAALVLLMSTAWAVLTGAEVIRTVGDMARFGGILLQILAPLQMALVIFFAAIITASAVAQEKDRRTLVLLLMTRLSNSELVIGKLMASLLSVLVMLLAAVPVFLMAVLFGGVSFAQVGRIFAVTGVTALAAGSLGAIIAFWRDKTFQALALTALVLFFWLGLWEAVAAGVLGSELLGVSCETVAIACSPLQAVRAAARPFLADELAIGPLRNGVHLYLLVMSGVTFLLCAVAVWRVRVWNPSRQVRGTQSNHEHVESIWGAEHDAAQSAERAELAEAARAGHVDAKLRQSTAQQSREMWDNPILWREMRTWAYGRKIIVIRAVYCVMAVLAAFAVYGGIRSGTFLTRGDEMAAAIPAAARSLAPLFLLSLVIVNALAVTSVTTERDGKSLDLLLATDLSPREFVFGKLGGVLSVCGLMVLVPLLLTIYLWWGGGLSTENLLYVLGGLVTMNLFVAILGLHCGMRYANSRTAIGISLGTVFFLFLGVVACILMMISFSGSFQVQLAPFLAFIVGGGIGLYVSLGAGNPSKAIGAAAIFVPFATFYGITSFLLGNNLSVFLVTVAAYGFATSAMMIPALFEFDFAMGRTSTAEE
jgi:ABC-type transport system involved in multi-copper enzyme maturation permease subunit